MHSVLLRILAVIKSKWTPPPSFSMLASVTASFIMPSVGVPHQLLLYANRSASFVQERTVGVPEGVPAQSIDPDALALRLENLTLDDARSGFPVTQLHARLYASLLRMPFEQGTHRSPVRNLCWPQTSPC